jgi:hypothetical protein
MIELCTGYPAAYDTKLSRTGSFSQTEDSGTSAPGTLCTDKYPLERGVMLARYRNDKTESIFLAASGGSDACLDGMHV